MKKTILFLTLVSVILMLKSCSSDYDLELKNVMEYTSPSTKAADVSSIKTDYAVDSHLLAKYMRLSGKSKRQHIIIPLVKDGDSLAYCVQYEDGWDIISGDTRCAPVMIASESGICNTSDYDVQGLLSYLKDVKNSNLKDVNTTWELISKKQESNGTVFNARAGGSPESFTVGMWRAIDTVLIEEQNSISHIIQSYWHQDSPWDYFTPYVNGEKAPVGCAAVATGQIIHHYRKNNAMGVEFPTIAWPDNKVTVFPNKNGEGGFDALRWSTMAQSIADDDCDAAALMLAYLGQEIIGLTYKDSSTVIPDGNIRPAFDWGKLDYDEVSGYDWGEIYYSLLGGSPVCVYTAMMEGSDTSKHVYIIDRYKEENTYYQITCQWDPDYVVSEEEYYANDPEMFIESASEDEKIFEKGKITYTYWGMKWGYASSSYDNRFYMSRSYNAGGSDDAGVIAPSVHVNATFWDSPIGQTGDIHYILYNFENKVN